MVYCRMDGKETDIQRDEEHEAEIVDADFWSMYFGACIFFGYAVIRNILVYQFGYDYLGDLIHYTKFN